MQSGTEPRQCGPRKSVSVWEDRLFLHRSQRFSIGKACIQSDRISTRFLDKGFGERKEIDSIKNDWREGRYVNGLFLLVQQSNRLRSRFFRVPVFHSHTTRADVKAVTLHCLQLVETSQGWKTQIILDIWGLSEKYNPLFFKIHTLLYLPFSRLLVN